MTYGPTRFHAQHVEHMPSPPSQTPSPQTHGSPSAFVGSFTRALYALQALLIISIMLGISGGAIAQSSARVIGPSADTGKVYGIWKRAASAKGNHTLDNLLIRDVSVTCSGNCLEIEDNSAPVTVQGGVWHHRASPEKISAIFTNKNGGLILSNVVAIGNYDGRPVKAEFANTDGAMAAQRTLLTVNGGTFRGFWDAGIDTKAMTTMTGTVTAEDNRVSLKVWGPLVGDTLVSINSRDGDVAALKSPVVTGNIYLRKIVVRNSNPNGLLASFQGDGGVIRIDECELHVPATYRVSWVKAGSKNTKLILGPTCAKDGKVVVAPLKPLADAQGAQIVNAGQLLPDGSRDGLIKLGAVWAAKLKLKTGTVVRHLDGFRYQVVP
jgi:hypothetical protein